MENNTERLDEETAFSEAMAWKEANDLTFKILCNVKKIADILRS